MSPSPTGHLRGGNLNLTRAFRASIDDVWTSITRSDSTARWIGPWRGDAGPGKTVQLNMVFEQGDAWVDVLIETCEAPRHLVVTTRSDYGSWRLEATLHQRGEITELAFVHHAVDRTSVGEVGPGWEYYFDKLVASRDGTPTVAWADYYPAMKEHYLELAREPPPPTA